MIHFFRDVLDGPIYIVLVILCVIFIMAIIGFIMERKQLEKEKMKLVAVVGNQVNTPITPVSIEEQGVVSEIVNKTIASPVMPVNNDNVVNTNNTNIT